MTDQHISLSLQVNLPSHSWDKAILNFDLENSRSSLGWWSKVKITKLTLKKVTGLAQYPIDSLHFGFTSIRSTIPEKELFQIFKVKAMCEVKEQGHIVDPVSNRSTSFSFHVEFWDMVKSVFDIEKKTSEFLKNHQIQSLRQNSSKM